MKHIIIIALCCFSLSSAIAQNSEGKKVTYVYKTYEDLLSRTNGLERNYIPCFGNPDKLEYFVEGSKRGKKFDMKDSLSFYVGYETWLDEYPKARNYYNQKLGRFTCILGGDKNYFMTGSGRDAKVNYLKDGYAYSVFGDEFFSWNFVKMEGNKQIYINNIKEIIKDDTLLLKQYVDESLKESNARVRYQKEFYSDLKYLKLYNEKHK